MNLLQQLNDGLARMDAAIVEGLRRHGATMVKFFREADERHAALEARVAELERRLGSGEPRQ